MAKRYICVEKVNDNYNVDTNASGGDIEANKTATIDVSAYTTPVEITPTSGKDAMAKTTVTLSNIPSGGNTIHFYCWQDTNSSNSFYYTLNEEPVENDYVYKRTGVGNTLGILTTTFGNVTADYDGVNLHIYVNGELYICNRYTQYDTEISVHS